MPAPVVDVNEDAKIGVICMGSTQYAIHEARARLAEAGQQVSLLRLRGLPIGEAVRAFISEHERTVVVEMNRDGQLCGILRAELPDLAARIHSVAHLDGLPYAADQIEAWLAPHLVATGELVAEEVV